MYISIKLPPAFGSFNRLRMENYPFNSLFTAYLKAISRLGMDRGMDVGELVGYIEDRLFEGRRLPDVPEGDGPVNVRYKTDDPDIERYIGENPGTNRMAIMYIARMTLRLSVEYGTSLFRLTRLIEGLSREQGRQKAGQREPAGMDPVRKEPVRKEPARKEPARQVPEPVPMPRISGRVAPVSVQPAAEEPQPASSVMESARKAMEALNGLDELTSQAAEGQDVVEQNPALLQFM